MEEFKDDDVAYLRWIQNNPTGFVINSYRKPKSRYLILHRATCGTISSPKISNWTTTGYIKICSLNISDLSNWAHKTVKGTLDPCSLCNPYSKEI